MISKIPADTHVRNDSIRQGITKKRVEDFANAGPVDCIIIGSGLSGLTTAGMLSRAGWRVAVLEQHDVAGGTTHQFVEEGFEFGTGLHYTGDVLPRSTLMDALTDGKLKWAEMDAEYDHCELMGKDIDEVKDRLVFTKGFRKMRDRLHKQFPEECMCEKEAISRYYKECFKAHAAMGPIVLSKILPGFMVSLLRPLLDRWYHSAQNKTTLEVMRDCGLSDDLIGKLTFTYGDFGTTPDESPFMVQAMLTCHWFRGAFYPVGGPEQIAATMVPTLEKNGSKVWVNARVETLLLSADGAVEGVRVKGMDIPCNTVVSSVGALNTYMKLMNDKMPLPRPVQDLRHELRSAEKLKPGMSMISLFVGFEGTCESLQLPNYNTWMVSSWDHGANIKRMNEEGLDAPFAMMYYAFSSAKDPTWHVRFPNKVSCEILAPCSYALFEEFEKSRWNKRTDDYEAMKEVLTERLLDHMFERMPHLKDKLVHVSMGTPLTINHFLNSTRGEVYALDHTQERFDPKYQQMLTAKTPITGLYMTGQDVLFSGVVTAYMSGIVTVAAMSYSALLKNADVLFRATPTVWGESQVKGAKKFNIVWVLSVVFVVLAVLLVYMR
ncbi:hypothetical protein SARC_02344 [Sphaeroforma arctica JP610]|uniref:Amine oxidase domain-containing protein n=1 Tax=Sphaeroforma arctica JP610 TaxID=667725 RepID=A0A0L0G981_9EUKA|nr:hypothetical protein SARC_02344 [Sphaeroforma arctica JP610]KNC85474.1 hypothetical protein SARC_02344 [Sphaeroforma arctica JP610]|eukprot:XP_014159376.1 hypothetical protein SARC_02344 [Sphaeroforma arctica JP610]